MLKQPDLQGEKRGGGLEIVFNHEVYVQSIMPT